jgi:hypothetical protein
MKNFFKKYLLLIVIIFFLFTIFFTYREGVDRSEWITPGDDNKDRYYNEHKTSGNPEIDAIQFNHRAKRTEYVDSNLRPTIYELSPPPPVAPAAPIKQLTNEMWESRIPKPRPKRLIKRRKRLI